MEVLEALMHRSAINLDPHRSRGATSIDSRSSLVAMVRGFADVHRAEPALAWSGVLLLLLAIPSAAGVWLDDRVITGAPAWLKPTKFAVATGVYEWTLAAFLTAIPEWTRTRRLVSLVTVVVMWLEIAIIDLQAWRGTTSHFNFNTPFDATLFSIMGAAIFGQTAASAAVAVALWRRTFADRARGWALRCAMTLTIAGALTGGLMTGPTDAQLADARAGSRLTTIGAHTVGAPDGGPGLPVTGWSTRHGDLRVPHFVGLHAMQVLPLVVLAARRRREPERTRFALGASALYALTFVLLLVQALRGVPLAGIGS